MVGLPVDYYPFVTSITTKIESPSLDDVFVYLDVFEAHKLQHTADIVTKPLVVHHLAKFVAILI